MNRLHEIGGYALTTSQVHTLQAVRDRVSLPSSERVYDILLGLYEIGLLNSTRLFELAYYDDCYYAKPSLWELTSVCNYRLTRKGRALLDAIDVLGALEKLPEVT